VQQQQEPQARQLPVADPVTKMQSRKPAPGQHQPSGQSVPAPTVNSQPFDMVRVVSVVRQIITELSGAVSEDDTIVAITKIVFKPYEA
jgi:hypothetical protein